VAAVYTSKRLVAAADRLQYVYVAKATPIDKLTDSTNAADCDLPGDREPLELPLVRALWRWSAGAQSDPDDVATAVSDVAGWMEGFLCGVFAMSKTPGANSWWSDGVTDLQLSQSSPTSIEAIGATIWAGSGPSFYLAPFECEFYFASPNDPECLRIVVRFGKLDRFGNIVRLPYDSNAGGVIASRPKTNSDWALAVELS